MRFAARCIAMMAVASVIVPALRANDAAEARVREKKDEGAVSVFARPALVRTSAMAAPHATYAAPSLWSTSASASPQGPAGVLYPVPTPRVEWFLGYSFWRAMPTANSNRIGYLHGGSTSLAYNFNSWLGLAVDFGGYANSMVTLFTPTSSQTVDSDGRAYTLVAGPRFSYRGSEWITPFVHALFGMARATAVNISGCTGSPTCTPLPTENALAMMFGGGFDVKLSRHVALRLVQADYLLTRFNDPFSLNAQGRGWQNNVRFSSGIVFRFGGDTPPPPVNRAPTASCSVDRNMVYVDSGDAVAVSVSSSDPENDALTYTWSANGGRVDGTGPQVRWLSAGTAPGTYTVTAHVDDAHGGTANCTGSVRVETRANALPTISCSADRASVLVGERVRLTANASDPDNDQLTYTWRASAGQVAGSGAGVDFNTAGLAPGRYTVTTRVEDGRGGAADCTSTIDVRAVPAPPQASKANECMFNAPSSARIDNVCKRILDNVALRLQSEPRASVVIVGSSDTSERRATLAGDRATNAVRYLGEKGIDASRVTTRTVSGQSGAGAQNRRIDVIWVPEGATY